LGTRGYRTHFNLTLDVRDGQFYQGGFVLTC
jgi:hypothetical protein